MQFDFAGAREAGATDEQIVKYLSTNYADAFDFEGAFKAGATPDQVVGHLEGLYAEEPKKTKPGLIGRAIDAVGDGINFAKEVYVDAQKREDDRLKQESYARSAAADKEMINAQLNGLSDRERKMQVESKAAREKYLSSPVEAVSEIAKQGIGGLVVDAPAAINKAGQAFSPAGSGAEEFFKSNAASWEENAPAFEPQTEGKGVITQAFMGGARAVPLSGTAMAAAGVSMLAGATAAPVATAASIFALFGGSQFTDTYEKGLKAGLPVEEAKKAALIAGGIEGAGETLGDYVGGKFLTGLGKAFVGKIGTTEAVSLATNPRWAAKFAGDFLGNMGVQASTEYGQGFGETAVENRYGISDASPIEQANHGAKTAMAMSVLLGGGAVVGHQKQAEMRRLSGDLLQNPYAPIDERAKAADYVRQQMSSTIGEDAANQWHQGMVATIGLDKLNNPLPTPEPKPQHSDPADIANQVLSTPETGNASQDLDNAIAAADELLNNHIQAEELLSGLDNITPQAPQAIPPSSLINTTQPTQEVANVLPETPANAQPDLHNGVPVGVEVRPATGSGEATATDTARTVAVDGQLATGPAQRDGDAAGVDAQLPVGGGSEALASPLASTLAIPSQANTGAALTENQNVNTAGEIKLGGNIAPNAPAPQAQPVFGTNAQGRVTLRGVPQEQIKAVRDTLKLKGVIIGKDNAIFPKGTDIAVLKNEFAPKPVEAAKIEAVAKPENEATYSTFKDGKMIRVAANGVPPAMFGAKFEKQAKEYYEGLRAAADPKAFAEEWSQKVKAESAIQPSAQPKESAIDAALRSVGIDPNAPQDKAKALRREAEKLMKESSRMLDGIPAGQPVRSTQDRNLRDKSMEKARKASELYAQAEELETSKSAQKNDDQRSSKPEAESKASLPSEQDVAGLTPGLEAAAPQPLKESSTAQAGNAKQEDAAQSKKLEVIKAQAQGKITGDQGAALKELADAGEHAAVDEVLKPANETPVFTLKKQNVGEGIAYKIMVNGKSVGHLSGFERYTPKAFAGSNTETSFHLYRTEIADSHADLRGTGLYRQAVQQVANEYEGGLWVHEWEASKALRTSLAKMPTYELNSEHKTIRIQPESAAKPFQPTKTPATPISEKPENLKQAQAEKKESTQTKETDKGIVLFSQSSTQSIANPHTLTSATEAILNAHTGKIKGAIKAMMDEGKFRVVTATQAANILGKDALFAKSDQDKNADIRYSKEGGALAFYNLEDQVTYFIADNIPQDYSAERWRGLVRHEIAVHALKMGRNNYEVATSKNGIARKITKFTSKTDAEDFIGEQRKDGFTAEILDNEWDNMLSQFERRRKVDRKVKAAFERVPMDTPFDHVTEEAFAYYIQYRAIPKQEDDGQWHVYAIDDQEIGVFRTMEAAVAKARAYNDAFAKNDPVIKKFIVWLRNALREIGKRLPAMQKLRFMEWANSLTESDLLFMANDAIASWKPSSQNEAGQILQAGVMLSREEINRERYQRLVDKLKELYGGRDGYESLIDSADRYLRRYSDPSKEYLEELYSARKLKEGSETVRRRLLEQENAAQGSSGEGAAAFASLESRGRVGGFDGYVTEASLQDIAGYGNYFAMEVWPAEFDGKDGSLDSPILTITLNPTDDTRFSTEKPHGELVIYGPKHDSETFRILQERGWAEVAKGKGGETAYLPDGSPWTRLTGVTPAQLTALLSDAHARVRLATGAAHLGVNWDRATGATGFATEHGDKEASRKSAIYFSREQSSIVETPPAQPPRQGNIPLQGGKAGSRASWDSPEPSFFDDVLYKLQDKNIDLKRVTQAIRDAGVQLSEKWDTYRQEELFHGRAAKRVHDFVNTELKPMMVEMQARGIKLDELDKFLHARHAKEANALIAERDPNMPDGGSGMTNAEADKYMAGLGDKRKRLEAAAAKVDAIIAKTRDLYVSYGLISKDQADSWAQMFEHYVPLMREDHDGGMGVGQGFSIKGKEAKHRTGSTAKVVDILANIAMQREKAIVRGEKNRVAVSLAGLAKLNPNPEFWTFGQPPTERVLNEKTGMVEERIDPTFKSKENEVVAKIKDGNGQVHERAIIFNESNERALRMAEAIKNLDASQLNWALSVSAVITRWFASVNTQYNPIFGVTNLIRDVQGAALNLTSTPLAGKQKEVLGHIASAAKGIYLDARSERKGKPATSKWAALWEELQDEGGMTGYRDLYRTSADRAKAIEHELDPHNWVNSKWGKVFTANGTLKVPLTMAQDVAGPLFDLLSDYNQMMEGSTRLAIYKTAIDHGLTKQEAASLAKNTTVNFNRRGAVGQQAGALYAFFNAAMQGTARIGQTVFDMKNGDIKTLRLSKTGKAIVGGGMLLGVMQALVLAAAGFDDDEPPEFIRERSMVIPIGGKKYISIPMPLGFHVLPNIGRVSTEFVLGGFRNPADHVIRLTGIFLEAFNPIGSSGMSLQTVMPTAVDPMMALAENRDWTGKPIYKEDFNSMKPTPGFTRNKDTASAWSKFIAEGINYATGGTDYSPGKFSPSADQIDFLIGQVTGGVGRELSKLAQTGGALVTGEELPTHKIPLLGRFYGDTESQSSQGNRFYANLKEINRLDAEIKGRREDKLPTNEFMRENPKYRLISQAKYADNIIGKLRKRKRELIEKDAPRDSIRGIEDRITKEMLRFNQAVERIEAVPIQ